MSLYLPSPNPHQWKGQLGEPPEARRACGEGAGPAGAWGCGAVFSSVQGAPEGVRLGFGTWPKGGREWNATAPQTLRQGYRCVLGRPCMCVSGGWDGGPKKPELLFQGHSGDGFPSCGLLGSNAFSELRSKVGWTVLPPAHKVRPSSSSTCNYS